MNCQEQRSGTRPAAQFHHDSALARVSSQLGALEKRDLELWVIIILCSTLVAAGLLATIAPAVFFAGGPIHVAITVSKEAFIGLVALVALMNVYLIWRRMEVRKSRQQLISTTLQSELARLQSLTDPLTEVYSRKALEDLASKYMSHAQRLCHPLTFLVVDIYRFKEVNTRFGRLTGDIVLAEMAALLKSCVRGSDAVVRFGGDEFLIILANSPRDGANRVAARIASFVEDWNRAGHLKGFHLTLSIGIAAWEAGTTLHDVLSSADQEMHADESVR